MHFQEGDVVCGVDVALAKPVVTCVDTHQWCSAAAVARELGLPLETIEPLIRRLHEGGYLDSPHHGPLPDGYESRWLPTEEADGDALLLWHITSQGKTLAKAPIGPALTREEADQLLEDILRRCERINGNGRSSHRIESVTLFGSMCDPDATEFGDVDVVVMAQRRCGDRHDVAPRIQLEGFLRSRNERADVVVIDESWREGSAIPEGARVREVYSSR
jgi:predicted nucleotidyltransferase